MRRALRRQHAARERRFRAMGYEDRRAGDVELEMMRR
jgi:hypothetical protein